MKKILSRMITPYLSKMGNRNEDVIREIRLHKLLLGRMFSQSLRTRGILPSIQDAEFQVFSQTGEDGILQYLIHQIPSIPPTYIEFGVQDYSESNTLFLMLNDYWRGLVIDMDEQGIQKIRSEWYYWQHDLKAVCEFITCENINDIFLKNGFSGEIGVLSIDIDGNDYWVWKSIEAVQPVIVVVEYNSVFGSDFAVTIPYQKDFDRRQAHFSHLYWGASLKAFCLLADEKGYEFVGSNRAGFNAFFVRKDKLGNLSALSADEGYVVSQIRDARDEEGNLMFASGTQRFEIIKEMMVLDVESGKQVQLKDLVKKV